MAAMDILYEYSVPIGIALLMVGLILAYWGLKTWRFILPIIGGMIGFYLGLFISSLMGLTGFTPYIVGAVCAAICSSLFGLLANFALSAALAAIVAYGVFSASGGIWIAGSIAGALMFFVFYSKADELVELITSAIGGGMAALGAYLMYYHQEYMVYVAPVLGLGLFISGLVYQYRDISHGGNATPRARKKRTQPMSAKKKPSGGHLQPSNNRPKPPM